MKLYHVTFSKYVPEILRKGLTAGKKRGLTESLYGHLSKGKSEFTKAEKGTLYFLDDLESTGEFISVLGYGVRRPTRFSVLEIDLPSSASVEPDRRQFGGGAGALGGFLRSSVTKVPPSRIRVLGSVVVKPSREPTYELATPIRRKLELGRKSSELASVLEEPGSKEEETKALEGIRELPKESRAHVVARERAHRLRLYEGLVEQIEKED